MPVQLIEILGRATQGITRPFICRGDDGHVYFVKGRGAGRRSLICEWICGQLALKLGLSIAPFEIVQVPEALLVMADLETVKDLGVGFAFGSRQSMVVELSISHINGVPVATQRDVLAFDWWVRNQDRTLTKIGGNPNLFWSIKSQQLVVIDHNLAFDPEFNSSQFLDSHVFSGQRHALFDDWVLRQEYNNRLAEVMTNWDEICHTLPPAWRFIDAEETLPTQFDFNATRISLMRFQDANFWSQI
jgi:hypothetical protein